MIYGKIKLGLTRVLHQSQESPQIRQFISSCYNTLYAFRLPQYSVTCLRVQKDQCLKKQNFSHCSHQTPPLTGLYGRWRLVAPAFHRAALLVCAGAGARDCSLALSPPTPALRAGARVSNLYEMTHLPAIPVDY